MSRAPTPNGQCEVPDGNDRRSWWSLIGNLVNLASNAEAEDIYAQEMRVEDGASARNIYAARVHIGNNCKITGVIEYSDLIEVGTG